jgi:hypothetical protein
MLEGYVSNPYPAIIHLFQYVVKIQLRNWKKSYAFKLSIYIFIYLV